MSSVRRGFDFASLQGLDIRRVSTTDQVVDALRDAILDGEIAPGTPLREIPLATALNVSRNTLREALRILQADGLARYRLNYGVVVVELDETDLEQIFRFRTLIEVPAAQAAAEAGDPELLRELEQHVREMERAGKAGDAVGMVGAHRAFHATLVSALRNPRVEQVYAGLQRELVLALARADRTARDLRKVASGHRRIVRALRAGPAEAADSVREHLDEALRTVRAQLPAEQPATHVPGADADEAAVAAALGAAARAGRGAQARR
ncbi:MAG TPA: GntR family transcriptional regulator [Conexibacter sp.]|nr:GntR family transcriptional regulator [Conexibacter sp.]